MTGLTGLVTLLALGVYFWTGIEVSRARNKYKVPAPATTGNVDFERVFRVQQNTLEWLPVFLATLWMFSTYWPSWIGALIGLVWVVGRVLYLQGYKAAADKRELGFTVQAVATLVLFVGALIGVVMGLIDGGAV